MLRNDLEGINTQNQTQVQSVQCPNCGSQQLVNDEVVGEIACSDCGLVLSDEMVNMEPEWRAFTIEEKRSKSRVGAPTDYTYFDKGLSTTMWVNRDFFGQPLPANTKFQMWRLRKWQARTQLEGNGRNLITAMNELERLSEKLNIPKHVQETAAITYRKALKMDLVRGRSIATIAIASLYAACRLTGTLRTLRRIIKASAQERKKVAKCYRLILQKLEMKVPVPDPRDNISKIAEKAHISGESLGLAINIVREANHKNLTAGKDPRGIAAATLYIACHAKGEKITQKEIADAADITEVTLRNRRNELVKKLSYLNTTTNP